MTSLNDIGTSALINCVSAIIFFLCFMIFKVQPLNDRVYFPKWYIKDPQRKGSPSSRVHRRNMERYFETTCRPYGMSFSWIASALRMPEQNLIEHAGLDAVVYLRIYQIGLKIFVPLMIMGLSIIVTINVGGGHLNTLDSKVNINSTMSDASNSTSTTTLLYSDIDKLSISNVPKASKRLWTHLVMAYVFTGWTCFILYNEYKTISKMRLQFQSTDRRHPEQFTVLVRQVPQTSQESIYVQVQKYFQVHHLDYYLSHQLVYNANKLAKIVRKRETEEEWLSFWLLKFQRSNQKPTTRAMGCGLCGAKVDAIELYLSKIENLNKQTEAERKRVHQDASSTMPTAFVSFKSRWGAAVCAQTQQNMDPTTWMTGWAPEPRDIHWTNLAIPYMQLECRGVTVALALFLLVFCFMIPVAIIQSLASLQGLKSKFPQLEPLLEQKMFASFIQGFLPGFILKVCMLVVQYIAKYLAIVEGHVSLSGIEKQAARKYYYFMIVNVFFGSILTGSAFQQLQSFVNSSSVVDFIKTLAYTIPMKATFFITYIMVDGWAGAGFEILRPLALVLYHIKNSLFVHTTADKMRAMDPGPICFFVRLAQLQLYFLMGLVYSVITPIILPFIVLSFAINYVVYRHQVINVYEAAYESAGAFWPFVHGYIILSLVIEHLMLIGLFLIQGPITFSTIETNDDDFPISTLQRILINVEQYMSSTPFIIALPIFTYIFHRYCKSRFEPCFTNFPLEHATQKDIDDKANDPNFNISHFLQNSYKHPNFIDEKPIEETKKSIKSFERNTAKKKSKSSIPKEEKLDSTIDIPNVVKDVPLTQVMKLDDTQKKLKQKNSTKHFEPSPQGLLPNVYVVAPSNKYIKYQEKAKNELPKNGIINQEKTKNELQINDIKYQEKTNNELPTDFVPTPPNITGEVANNKEPKSISTSSMSTNGTSTLTTSPQTVDEEEITKEIEKMFDSSPAIFQQKEAIEDKNLDVSEEKNNDKNNEALASTSSDPRSSTSNVDEDAIYQNYQPTPKKEPKYVGNYAKPLKGKKKK